MRPLQAVASLALLASSSIFLAPSSNNFLATSSPSASADSISRQHTASVTATDENDDRFRAFFAVPPLI